MNKKTREVIKNLKSALESACATIDSEYNAHSREYDRAIDAAEKLLNPPVKFLWIRGRGSEGTPGYDASVGRVYYHVERNRDKAGNRGWSAWASADAQTIGYPESYLGEVHPTLALAKQACVDYGVARARAATT
jgi:hypothetical protein